MASASAPKTLDETLAEFSTMVKARHAVDEFYGASMDWKPHTNQDGGVFQIILMFKKKPISIVEQNDRLAMVADGLLSVAAAARLLGIGKSSVYVLMDSGQLVYVKIGKSRRIPKHALLKFIADAMTTGPIGNENPTQATEEVMGQEQKPIDREHLLAISKGHLATWEGGNPTPLWDDAYEVVRDLVAVVESLSESCAKVILENERLKSQVAHANDMMTSMGRRIETNNKELEDLLAVRDPTASIDVQRARNIADKVQMARRLEANLAADEIDRLKKEIIEVRDALYRATGGRS